MKIGKNSCTRVAKELSESCNIPDNDMMQVEDSYDGAYQRRGGSKGGGHPR